LHQIITHGGVLPSEEKLVKPFVEKGDDRENRPGLDDDVKQLRPVAQPMFRDQQMASRGDGQEFGDSFNDSQNDDADPKWHRMVRSENEADDKEEMGRGT